MNTGGSCLGGPQRGRGRDSPVAKGPCSQDKHTQGGAAPAPWPGAQPTLGRRVLAHRPRQLPPQACQACRPRAPHLQPVLALTELAVGLRGPAPVPHGLKPPREGDAAAPQPLGDLGAGHLLVHLAGLPEAVLRLSSATRSGRQGHAGPCGRRQGAGATDPGPATGFVQRGEEAPSAWPSRGRAPGLRGRGWFSRNSRQGPRPSLLGTKDSRDVGSGDEG